MNWLSIISLVLRHLPEIIKVVVAIIALIRGLSDKSQAKVELTHLRNNIAVAKEQNDFAGLEQQLARLKAKCKSC